MKDYYAILGVAPSATLEEIEAAYRQKAKQYHPDKVSHLGPEFRELAERRMKEINEAYQVLIKLRGGQKYRRYKQSTSEQHEKTSENKTAPGTAKDVKTPEAEVVKSKTRFRKSTIILMLLGIFLVLVFLAGFLAVLSLNRVENLAQQYQQLAGKVSALEQTRASPSIPKRIKNLVKRVIALEQAQQELEFKLKKSREQKKQQLPIPTAKRIQTIKNQITPVYIGDGLWLSNAYFTLEERHRGYKYPTFIGQITNNSQQSYYSPNFEIRIYDSNGQFLTGRTFQLGGKFDSDRELPSKKTRSFEVSFPATTKKNIGEYEIQFVGD